MAELDTAVLQVVLEQHRNDIIRSLRARGHRLLPGQVLEFRPVESGVGVIIMVTTPAEQAARMANLSAKEFFSNARFKDCLGWNSVIIGTLQRLHRIVNGHPITVAKLLDDPDFSESNLAKRPGWETVHVNCLQDFLRAHGLSLKP